MADTTNGLTNGSSDEALNARDIFVCPQELGSLWYLGQLVTVPTNIEQSEPVCGMSVSGDGELLLRHPRLHGA